MSTRWPIFSTRRVICGKSRSFRAACAARVHRGQLYGVGVLDCAIAADLANMKRGTNRYEVKVEGPNGHSKTITLDVAAEMMQVSKKSVVRAKKVKETEPEAHDDQPSEVLCHGKEVVTKIRLNALRASPGAPGRAR